MSFQQFFFILRARYRTVLLVLLGTVILALAASLLIPPRYSAQASVVVDIRSPDPVAGMLLPALAIPFYMTAQIDVINSDRVAEKVVKSSKLDDDPVARQEWLNDTEGKGDIRAWLAEKLLSNLDVKPSRDSNIISVTYKATDPNFAAAMANAFAQAYIDTTIELKVEPAKQYARWFEGQGKILRDNLEKAQRRLSAYQQEYGIVSVEERFDVETARLGELSAQFSAVLGQTTEAQSKQRSGAAAATLPEIVQNPLIQQLKADLARAEGRLEELSSGMGENHPEYQAAESLVASLKTRLESETQHIIRGFTASRAVGKKRQYELQAAIDAQKRKLLEIRRARDELGVLTRDVEAAQRAYEQVAQRINQTTLESQFTQTNASILTSAGIPLKPVFPKLPLNLWISIFLGTLLGVGAAMLAEIIDRRVRSGEDVTWLLQLPVLGTIERVNRSRGHLLPSRVPLITS
jgi:polysaccharide biosynthesis transport protein